MSRHFNQTGQTGHFSRADRDDLLKCMGRSLSLSRVYSASKGLSSTQHKMVDSLRDAIKVLAADLTNDPDYYGDGGEARKTFD
jgi:hypothetical protein